MLTHRNKTPGVPTFPITKLAPDPKFRRVKGKHYIALARGRGFNLGYAIGFLGSTKVSDPAAHKAEAMADCEALARVWEEDWDPELASQQYDQSFHNYAMKRG